MKPRSSKLLVDYSRRKASGVASLTLASCVAFKHRGEPPASILMPAMTTCYNDEDGDCIVEDDDDDQQEAHISDCEAQPMEDESICLDAIAAARAAEEEKTERDRGCSTQKQCSRSLADMQAMLYKDQSRNRLRKGGMSLRNLNELRDENTSPIKFRFRRRSSLTKTNGSSNHLDLENQQLDTQSCHQWGSASYHKLGSSSIRDLGSTSSILDVLQEDHAPRRRRSSRRSLVLPSRQATDAPLTRSRRVSSGSLVMPPQYWNKPEHKIQPSESSSTLRTASTHSLSQDSFAPKKNWSKPSERQPMEDGSMKTRGPVASSSSSTNKKMMMKRCSSLATSLHSGHSSLNFDHRSCATEDSKKKRRQRRSSGMALMKAVDNCSQDPHALSCFLTKSRIRRRHSTVNPSTLARPASFPPILRVDSQRRNELSQ